MLHNKSRYLLCITLSGYCAGRGRIRHTDDALLCVKVHGQILFKPRFL